MKKTISILLVLVIALSLCACGNANSKYVGIWKPVKVTVDYGQYMYIYKDGTGDFYGMHASLTGPGKEAGHVNSFEWEINGEYFCIKHSSGTVSKYTFKDSKLYDSQGNIKYTFYSADTSKDIPLN